MASPECTIPGQRNKIGVCPPGAEMRTGWSAQLQCACAEAVTIQGKRRPLSLANCVAESASEPRASLIRMNVTASDGAAAPPAHSDAAAVTDEQAAASSGIAINDGSGALPSGAAESVTSTSDAWKLTIRLLRGAAPR
mmetsp:Transcript_21172/g.66415  ORF Transcript_21172/g.66415 Transcript_21172/m.66415 type:complete len:138 (+) Transcript_21172:80-493(+)